MNFGKRVKQLRTNLAWSQEDLAKKCGLQPSAIAHYEGGRREPTLTNIVRICKGFGVDPQVLIVPTDY